MANHSNPLKPTCAFALVDGELGLGPLALAQRHCCLGLEPQVQRRTLGARGWEVTLGSGTSSMFLSISEVEITVRSLDFKVVGQISHRQSRQGHAHI